MARVLLDCRWLPIKGAGRLTELLLRGLNEEPPAGDWVLWGPPDLARWAWPGAEHVLDTDDPRLLNGQRAALRIPRADLAVFMHQQRPLRPVPAVTVVLDTIALRNAPTATDRAAKRAFLKAVTRMSREVVTISEYSRRCISRDVGLALDRITVVRPPVDTELASRVDRLRSSGAADAEDFALYVGAFLPHKNLDRLVEAFSQTDFAVSGGRLVLAGGSDPRFDAVPGVETRAGVDQDALDRLYAAALFLVQPSLEEGFGLPVLEAMACGVPVCVSDAGALPEVSLGKGFSFPPTSVPAMAEAIDACAAAARGARPFTPPPPAQLGHPTAAGFAQEMLRVVERNLSPEAAAAGR